MGLKYGNLMALLCKQVAGSKAANPGANYYYIFHCPFTTPLS
jgi:hypothetical protein